MVEPLLIAFALVCVGIILVRSACKSIASGEAETEDDGVIHKKTNPIRFFLFIITQLGFGCIFIIAGVAFAIVILLSQ